MKILFLLFTGISIGVAVPKENAVFFKELSDACIEQTKTKITYDPSYFSIPYPNGDVDPSIGVCTDVVIRAYRKLGYDLQKLIHEDMKKAHAVYNKRRMTKILDTNIDHRRTPNMETYFTRQGAKQTVTENPADYLPGDIVFWDVATGHVGIVVDEKVPGTDRNYIVHNICCGVQKEDFLFGSKIVGHYRWNPSKN